MPWRKASVEHQRRELVAMLQAGGISISECCRRFGICRPTAYKWLHRLAMGEGVEDRSRRPRTSPRRTPPDIEATVLALRDEHPAWGGRKLHQVLVKRGMTGVPGPSGITSILRRYGRIAVGVRGGQRSWQRFESEAPNRIWQMDFKGPIRLGSGRGVILTVLDDYSRYVVALVAGADQRWQTVQAALTAAFQRYGMPDRILCDNGSPWGSDARHPHTPLTAWLLQLGILVTHGRPYHPQTQGKVERFHGTLIAEVLQHRQFADLDALQHALDRFHREYNYERPHDALDLQPPSARFRPSPRRFPEQLPAIVYGPDDQVRKVSSSGHISYRGRVFDLGRPFVGYPVAVRATLQTGVFSVHFCRLQIAEISLNDA